MLVQCCVLFVEMTDDGVDNTLEACEPDETEYEVDDSTDVSVLVDKSCATVVSDRPGSVVVWPSTVIVFVDVTSGDDEMFMIDVVSTQNKYTIHIYCRINKTEFKNKS